MKNYIKKPLNSIIKNFVYTIIIAIFLVNTIGCGKRLIKETRFLFDTCCEITLRAENKAGRAAINKAFLRMKEIESKFSLYREYSQLYKGKISEAAIDDKEVVEVVAYALEVAEESKGLFDPTVYPVYKLWWSNKDSAAMPDKKKLKKILKSTGYDKIDVSEGKIYLKSDDIKIDLGGIAKGYAVDEAVKVLRKAGIDSALVNAGGDLYALGRNGKKPWKVGIKNPRGAGLIGIIEVSDKAVATSGDYERFFIKDGKKYHHIIDPRTGYPSIGLQSVTIIGSSAMMVDAWATAVFVMGLPKGIDIIEKKKEYETIIVSEEGSITYSSGLKEGIRWLRKNNENEVGK